MKLHFAVIGGQKCGSTFIQHALNVHPQVDMIEGECPVFETPDYEDGGMDLLQKEIQILDSKKVLGLKRPNYFTKIEVPDRLYEYNPEMKLILLLRNPMERFRSAYFHVMKSGMGPAIEFNRGILGILSNKYLTKYPRTSEILEFGHYSKYLSRYSELFGDNLLVLLYDDLKSDSKSIIQEAYRFIGVSDNFFPHGIMDKRPQQVNYSIPSIRFLRLRNSFFYKYSADRKRLKIKDQNLLENLFNKFIVFTNQLLFSRKKMKQKPKFKAESFDLLINEYEKDIRFVEEFLGRDLSHWRDKDI